MKSVYVKDLEMGRPVDGIFVISRSSLRTYTGGQFLSLRLADRTGKVDAVSWDGAEALYPRCTVGSPVRVVGRVGQYQGNPQVVVDKLLFDLPEGEIDPADFIPTAPVDLEETAKELCALADTIENPWLSALWEKFHEDACFAEFCRAPGGKLWHHGYVGGLLEHTLSVCRCALRIAEGYPEVDRDVLLSAALFHDISKADELSCDTIIDYTDEGRLVGHLVLSAMRIEGLIRTIPDFPAPLRNRLLHAMLAHHGEAPGSPVNAMTREAMVLHHADHVDAHMNAYNREIRRAEAVGRPWTDYINLLGRHLYAGECIEPTQG